MEEQRLFYVHQQGHTVFLCACGGRFRAGAYGAPFRRHVATGRHREWAVRHPDRYVAPVAYPDFRLPT